MQILLTAPFHTDLNLKTFQAYRNQDNVIMLLGSVIELLNENVKFGYWTLNWEAEDESNTLYKSLDESYFPNAYKPIITLRISDIRWLNNVLQTEVDKLSSQLTFDFKIENCLVHFYDNTIGILSISVDLKDEIELKYVDQFTFDLSLSVLDVLKGTLSDVGKHFESYPYYLNTKETKIIFEADKYICYWVNRTIITNEKTFNEKSTEFNIWSKLYNDEYHLHDFNSYKIFFCTGNNIIVTEEDFNNYPLYLESLNLATYFYCLYMSLNNRVLGIFENIENHELFDINFQTLYQIDRLLLFIDSQNEKLIFSVQGNSKIILKSFYKIWHLELLRKNLAEKNQKVYSLYKFERLKKTEKTTKIVQGSLAIIGASAIVEVIINIVLFGHQKFEKTYQDYGISAFIKDINPEFILILNFTIIIILTILIIIEIRRK